MMSDEHIESPAFYRAILNSEWYRIVGLLGVLGALLVYTVIRGMMVDGFRLLWIQTAALAVVIVYEVLVMRSVSMALRTDRDVPPATWAINVFVESQLPTLTLFLLLLSHWMTPYQVLVAPAVMIYLLFIILSTLRLSPSLTVLTALLSALGYLTVTFFVEANFQQSRIQLGAFPLSFYGVYASLILISGVVAALVASRIKKYVAAALSEAQLQSKLEQVRHDLDIAKSIQQGLMPSQPPTLDQFEIAGWNQPADQTGGDYFDWQPLPDGRIAISLADATGHGIGPALVSASCRAYSRASLLAEADKNGLLDRLNGLLAEDLSANRFVTFAVLFLDPKNSHVKVLSAGHGPILLYRYGTGKIVGFEAQGIPLGMIAGVPYGHANEITLEAGDTMILITDGFYEWENPEGEQFGLERLNTTIRGACDCTAEEVIMELREAVSNFCKGTPQQDDLTAVVLKRRISTRPNHESLN